MKLKYHALFKTQLESFPADTGVGLLWYMIIDNSGRHIERMPVNIRNPVNDIKNRLKTDRYTFIEITNQMPVFKKL
jgi:hypothetical protein